MHETRRIFIKLLRFFFSPSFFLVSNDKFGGKQTINFIIIKISLRYI